MDFDLELENWLYDAGERVHSKLIARGPASLTPIERIVREVWLLNMQVCNGGVSQYFCNYGLEQWQALREAWLSVDLPSLRPIIDGIEQLILGADDAYLATLDASPGVEEMYEKHQTRMKVELRRLVAAAATRVAGGEI